MEEWWIVGEKSLNSPMNATYAERSQNICLNSIIPLSILEILQIFSWIMPVDLFKIIL